MQLENMIEIQSVKIEDAVKKLNVNAVVNSANPSLMGSHSNVDYAIHNAVDTIKNQQGWLDSELTRAFRRKYRTSKRDIIRCGRGDAVITKGYGFCEYIIYAVGPKSDWNNGKYGYSSSCVETLAACYKKIMKLIFEHPAIEQVAIPVISSGNYNFDFEYAFKIGLTTVYNELLDKKMELKELFDSISLKKIYFLVLDDQKRYDTAIEIFNSYQDVFRREHRAVARGAIESQKEFMQEVSLYDEQRGYFSVAKFVRQLLLYMRWIFGFWTFLKDVRSTKDWVVRRKTVEITAIIKMILPVILMVFTSKLESPVWITRFFIAVIVYDLLDTVTYLLSLLLHADIQRPSANITRSLIMLVVNYIEVQLEIAAIYYFINRINEVVISIREAITILTNMESLKNSYLWLEQVSKGINFFFLTVVFSYLSSHMRMRKFRTR
jgi:O-acetyl-ADP-ribose deacetylase (regulator of RNase III)